jgi:integrase
VTGHLRKRGKRSWSIVLDIGEDPATGKRRQRWHTVHGTKKAAERELTRLLGALLDGTYVEPVKLTLGEFLDRWLRDYAKPNVTDRTFERYKSIVEQHLKPALGRLALQRLQPIAIQAVYTQWREAGRKKPRKTESAGLSENTILQHHRVLHKALEMAVRWQLIQRNPADAVEPPKPKRREMKTIDEAQTAWALEFAEAKKSELYLPVLMAVTTGLRRGEILALRWQDVDFGAGILSVRRSLEETKSGLKFKDTKGKRSRVVDVPPILADALEVHRKAQEERRRQFGPDWQDNDLVFPREDGRPWKPDNFTSLYFDWIAKAGLKGIRFHDLRHSHAAQLIQLGTHPKVIQERLGHASTSFTLDVYGHLLPGLQRDAAQKLGESLAKARKDQKNARTQ